MCCTDWWAVGWIVIWTDSIYCLYQHFQRKALLCFLMSLLLFLFFLSLFLPGFLPLFIYRAVLWRVWRPRSVRWTTITTLTWSTPSARWGQMWWWVLFFFLCTWYSANKPSAPSDVIGYRFCCVINTAGPSAFHLWFVSIFSVDVRSSKSAQERRIRRHSQGHFSSAQLYIINLGPSSAESNTGMKLYSRSFKSVQVALC